MTKTSLVVHLQHGLQARAATDFVQKASYFNSDITIVKNEKSAAAKSIMGVMAMAVRKGEEIILMANGTDEQKAIKSLEGFLSKKEY
ncbi:HPr family phosphocarrier protein [Priestia abyssalis]|uniref:HPr family phosphocarrier protein n=1 Tax=Priestia abyssalis TaxID=1221450 RepID=UPI00099542B5|nr:HPr family phosphocarrier protein [Priestia abyssalis]